MIDIYPVSVDENDIVARKPLEKNGELYDYLMSIGYDRRVGNLEVYCQKQERANRPMTVFS